MKVQVGQIQQPGVEVGVNLLQVDAVPTHIGTMEVVLVELPHHPVEEQLAVVVPVLQDLIGCLIVVVIVCLILPTAVVLDHQPLVVAPQVHAHLVIIGCLMVVGGACLMVVVLAEELHLPQQLRLRQKVRLHRQQP